MKRIKHIAPLLAAALAAASCSLLDPTLDGRETLDEIFADNDKTAAYLNSCYQNIPAKSTSYSFVCNAPTALSDEAWYTYSPSVAGVPDRIYQGTGSATSHPLRDDYGTNYYYSAYLWQIRQCTTFLSRIAGANVNSESDRARWAAEAHALKAYFMLEMVKWFGTFGYESEGFGDNYDYSKLKKRSVWELAELIDKECSAAIACDELPWIIDNSAEALRMTKATAWCIKSKAYLFGASPVHSEDFTEGEKKEHWEKTYEVCSEAVHELEAHGYKLKTEVAEPDVYKGKAAAYHELFASSTLNTTTDMETIWQRPAAQSYLSHNYIGSYSKLQNATRAGVTPSQELVDAYDVLSPDGNTAEPLLDVLKPYNSDKSPNYNQAALDLGYDPEHPYDAERDPRMGACIFKNGDTILWDGKEYTVETFVGGDNGINSETEETRFTRTGYYFRKWVAPNADMLNGKTAAPWKYFRLAEIKLNLAEAAAEAGKLDEAKAQADEIRARVGMPALPEGLSQKEMIARVRNERMVELCYEEVRYFDVRRWAEGYENSELFKEFKLRCNKITAMWITQEEDGSFTYERKVGDLVNNSTRPRDLLLPIPETEAQTLYTLTGKRWQNTGW